MNNTITLDLSGLSQEQRTHRINEAVHQHVMKQEKTLCSSQDMDHKQGFLIHNLNTDTWRCGNCDVHSQREELFQHSMVFEALPRYSTSMDAAFTMMRSMLDHLLFSKRQGFYRQLAYVISQSHGITNSTIAWPDAISLMKPEHVCIAALGMFEIEVLYE